MKKIHLLILFLCSTINVFAQLFNVKMECPDSIGTDERFTVRYNITSKEIESDVSVKIKSPFNASNADPFFGPSISVRRSLNDHVYSCTYELESYSEEGEIIIAPMVFEITKNSKTLEKLTAPQKTIKVAGKYKEKAIAKPLDNVLKHDIKSDDIIVKWTASKQTLNLGDTIHCYCDIYTKIELISVESNSLITLDDCYIEEDSLPQERSCDVVNYNGYDCRHVRWASYKLTPLREGHFKIGGDTFLCKVVFEKPGIDPFEAFFGGEDAYTEQLCNIVAEAVEFDVNPHNISQQSIPKRDYVSKKTYLICDISTSMRSKDFNPDRETVVKDFTKRWLQKSTDCGLVTFAGCVESMQLSKAVVDTIAFPRMPKVDGTAIGDALLFPIANGENITDIILLTDGDTNAGHFTLSTALEILKEYNVRVSMLYLNSCNDSINYPVSYLGNGSNDYTESDSTTTLRNKYIDKKQLKSISKLIESTGGIYKTITTYDELMAVIPKLQTMVSLTPKKRIGPAKLDPKQVQIALEQLSKEIK